jgi:signal transduction histidine kinase
MSHLAGHALERHHRLFEIIKLAMFGPVSERYRAAGTDIFESGKHLLNLINEVLDLSKLEAGQFELQEEILDVAAVIEACVNLVEPQAEKAKVRLSKAINSGLPPLRADDRRMKQILLNLLSNASSSRPSAAWC